MEWSECFPKDTQPGMEQISAFAGHAAVGKTVRLA